MWKDKLPEDIKTTLEYYSSGNDSDKFLVYIFVLEVESLKYHPVLEEYSKIYNYNVTFGNLRTYINSKVEDRVLRKALRFINDTRNSYSHDLNIIGSYEVGLVEQVEEKLATLTDVFDRVVELLENN